MSDDSKSKPPAVTPVPAICPQSAEQPPVEEIGGPEGAEPTRFGDWEKAGRCSDF